MKRIAFAVAGGFLAGMLCTYALFSPRVLAQNHVRPMPPFANERFVLVDENQVTVGGLSFDSAGMPLIRFRGESGKALGGKTIRVMCEIRPWTMAEPGDGQ